MKRLLLLTLLATSALAQRDPAQYTRVLLPVHRSVGTPFGSWSMEWQFRNEGDQPADVFPLAAQCGLPLPGPAVFLLNQPSLAANETWLCFGGDALPAYPVPPVVPIVSERPGAFVYVERDASVSIGGALRWFSFRLTSMPVQMPAVPEADFFRGRRSILPVPLDDPSRYALRIYALPETVDDARVTVRVYDLSALQSTGPDEKLLSTITVALQAPEGRVLPCRNSPCDLPQVGYLPATAQLFDFVSARTMERSVRIEIEPHSETLRWWAMVSATRGATNDITLFVPR